MSHDNNCPIHASIGNHLTCIATYNNDATFMIVNYTALIVALVAFTVSIVQRNDRLITAHTGLVLLYFIFQFTLCLVVKCMGISIVWCAIIGATLTIILSYDNDEYRNTTWQRLIISTAIVGGFILIGFYAMTLAWITTLAHILAVLLGIVTERITIQQLTKTTKVSQHYTPITE